MNRTHFILVIVAAVVIGVGAAFFMRGTQPVAQACTMEAKVCPDGTSVGRVGPKCEFAPCPNSTSTTPFGGSTNSLPSTAMMEGEVGVKATSLGISVTPLAVVSDSRCPTDVQCVWAGTVELQALIETPTFSTTTILKLGIAQKFLGGTVTLTNVVPAKESQQTIPADSYGFALQIDR